MSLFETGFAVDAAAPAGEVSSSNRKRKHYQGQGAGGNDKAAEPAQDRVVEGQINLEKLMKKLQESEKSTSSTSNGRDRDRKGKGKERDRGEKEGQQQSQKSAFKSRDRTKPDQADKGDGRNSKNSERGNNNKRARHEAPQKKQPQQPAPVPATVKADKPVKAPFVPDEAALAKREERKRKKEARAMAAATNDVSMAEADTQPDAPESAEATGTASQKKEQAPVQASKSSSRTPLQQSMQKKLGGARFRWINEQLYTTSGDKAYELMRDDPSMFEEYHSGFRSQASSWPAQPLQLLVSSFLSSSARPVIADLGCGDAMLAQTLVPQGFVVLSYDLVPANSWIVEAQCAKHVPLPGSADVGEGAVVDAVVCCLSLMGHDWLNMIREARRILKAGGMLKIAEVSSRFSSVADFVALVSQVGFKLQTKDESNTHFVMFEFAKTASSPAAAKKMSAEEEERLQSKARETLKPCLYKKR